MPLCPGRTIPRGVYVGVYVIEAHDLDASMQAALAAHASGDVERARTLCEATLRADPRRPDAVQLLGLLAQQAGDLPRARALMEESVALRPRDARAHYNLAIVRTLQDDVAGAIAAYESAIAHEPRFAAAHSNLGNLYVRIDRRGDALRAYTAAIEAQPDFAAVYCNLAAVLIELGRYAHAIRALETAARFAPELPEIYVNLSHAYRRAGRIREALGATQRALALRPQFDAYLHLSLAAFEFGALDIALDANLRALELDPTHAGAHCNCASVYLLMGSYNEAIAAAQKAIERVPAYAEAHVNLALALLVGGDFARGWDEYAWTWRLPARRPSYPYVDRRPLWSGESFSDRRLLITREQGFGDAIFAIRYLPAVKARGGQVVLETAPELADLFSNLEGVDELRLAPEVGTRWDDVDLHVPILGLPRAFGTDLTSIPAAIPYLRAAEARVEHWRSRLERSAGLRVGIVWAGSAAHVDDRRRSVRLEDFAPLGDIDGIAWFGLQRGGGEAERRSCGRLTLDPLGPHIADFADAAAIVAQLDLVIAVDTALVHLAGAMGKPVWTLLPFAPDWRWMLERDDSPWYPTMRLFRQPQPGDWISVFAAVERALRDWQAASDKP